MNGRTLLAVLIVVDLLGSFSFIRGDTLVLDPGSPSWGTSNELLTDTGPPGGAPHLVAPGATLGLGPQNVIDALSDGNDEIGEITVATTTLLDAHTGLLFSVRAGSEGAPGTGVRAERAFDSAPPMLGGQFGHSADLFLWEGLAQANKLAPAPHGWRATNGDESNAGLLPPAGPGQPFDDVNAYDRHTIRSYITGGGQPLALFNQQAVPPNASVILPRPVFFSLRTGSPALSNFGATAGDILVVDRALYSVAGTIPTPGPANCGENPTDDDLDCESYESCPS